MRVQVTTATHVGHVRTENQDAAVNGASVLMDGPGTMRVTLTAPTVVAVIDGMGGHLGGRHAAAVTARHIAEVRFTGEDGVEEVTRALQRASDELFRLQETDVSARESGCVVTALVIEEGRCTLLNIGDAPALRLDHEYVVNLHTPDLSMTGDLTASIGGTPYRQELRPHVLQIEGSQPVVLCSDGLTDAVDDAELERLLSSPDPGLAGRMLDAALTGGAPDNVTISVIELDV